MASKRPPKRGSASKSIAKERIEILFKEAEESSKSRMQDSHRAVKRAREIGMKFRVRLPKEFKRKMCKECHHYLIPGKNCTIRLSQKRASHIVITCKDCGSVYRIPYKGKSKNSSIKSKSL